VIAGLLYVLFSSIRNGKGERFSMDPLRTLEKVVATPYPTPMPFYEMTIPHLRMQTFDSQLGELKKYSETAEFTSYLTSYSSDGLRINALLTHPKGQEPAGGWPGIVFVHGYVPPSVYRTTERYVEYVNYLARNGFAVMKIDLRGHGSSEGDPGGAYYSADYVKDTLNAYSALQKASFVNASQIGLWGHSMAGNILTRAIATKPTIPAAVIWAGAGYTYVDLSQYRLNDQSYRPQPTTNPQSQRRAKIRETYGEPNATSPFWELMAPTNYLSEYKGEIQLHHAIDDSVVSVEYSRNLVNILKETSVPHELFEYQSGGHNITNPNFTPAMRETVAFFKRTLTSEKQ